MARKRTSFFGIDEGLFNAHDLASADDPQLMFVDEEDKELIRKAEEKGSLRWIKTDLLDEDPDNRAIYGDNYDTDGLTQSVKENGFKGVIRAYPYGDGGRYMIESGHRSKESASRAGLGYVPVILTQAPEDDIERRERLYSMNLHMRKYSPLMRAREIEYIYQTEKMRRDRAKEEGNKADEHIHTAVAAKCEISESQVTKFRRLLSLSDSLQKLADSGEYSWSALAEASTLSPEKQEVLYKRIISYSKLHGAEAVSRAWLKDQIKDVSSLILSSEKYDLSWTSEYAKDESEEASEDAKKRIRSSNGAKAIIKSSKSLYEAFGEKAKIPAREKENTINLLREMKAFIESKLEELAPEAPASEE